MSRHRVFSLASTKAARIPNIAASIYQLLLLACRVRGAYKAVQSPKELEREMPECCLGSLLLSWIKQVRGA